MDPMAAAAEPPMDGSRAAQHVSVFVGNIPYSATEAEMIDVCEDIGPVVSFKFLPDKKRGGGARHKGSGFCEYLDRETALSALRNLDGVELHGRHLRVRLASSDPQAESKKSKAAAAKRKLPIAEEAAPSRTDLERQPPPTPAKLLKVDAGAVDAAAAAAAPVVNVASEAMLAWVHRQLMPEIPAERVWEVVQQIMRLEPEQLRSLSAEHQRQVVELQQIFTICW